MRVIIIGAGVIGCATALELRRLGIDVTNVDRNGQVGHGSTSASCGIVRRFYTQPGMIALAHEGAATYANWSDHLGPIDDELAEFVRPGMLFIPPAINDGVRATVEAMRGYGVDVEELDAAAVADRFPFFSTGATFPPVSPDDPRFLEESTRTIEGAVFEPDAGYVVSPTLATQNLALAARREGARFELGVEVTGIERTDDGVYRVQRSDGSVLEADVLVNIAGPHSSVIHRMLGVTLPLETRPLQREVHALANPQYVEGNGSPVPIVGDLDGGVYFRPESGGRDLIVGSTDPACDALEWVDDPDHPRDTITDEYRERQCLRLMRRFPEVTLGPPRGIGALYDVTVQDWYPIVDRTELEGYFVCIGTSGSSFKTAPVLGRLVAELIDAHRQGRDTDTEPLRFALPRIGHEIGVEFLSRQRAQLASSGTVIG